MPVLTNRDLESRQKQNERYAWGYRAASQAKGVMLTEAEMIRVRQAVDSGVTTDQLAAEFTPSVPRPVRDMRETLDAFAREIARLREDQSTYGAAIRQLQEVVSRLEAEIVSLRKVKKAA
jgi:hypothetical protein